MLLKIATDAQLTSLIDAMAVVVKDMGGTTIAREYAITAKNPKIAIFIRIAMIFAKNLN